MASNGDIQATRSTAAAGATAIIEPPIRLRGIIISVRWCWCRCVRTYNNFKCWSYNIYW